MSELGAINLWRLREKIDFGHYDKERLINGNVKRTFKTDFTRHAARYRVSQRMMLSNNGLDWQNNHVLAVRHLHNKEYENFEARWRGKIYKVTNVLPDDSKIMTYDLISLRSNEQND